LFYIEKRLFLTFLKSFWLHFNFPFSLFLSILCSVKDFSSRLKLKTSPVVFIPTSIQKDSIVPHELSFLIKTLRLLNVPLTSAIRSLLHKMAALFFPKLNQPELARDKKYFTTLNASDLYTLRILPYIFIILKDIFQLKSKYAA